MFLDRNHNHSKPWITLNVDFWFLLTDKTRCVLTILMATKCERLDADAKANENDNDAQIQCFKRVITYESVLCDGTAASLLLSSPPRHLNRHTLSGSRLEWV